MLKLTSIIATLIFLTMQPRLVSASPFSNSLEDIFFNASISNSLINLSDNRQSSVQFIDDGSTGNWSLESEHEIILIPFDGLVIPIETKKPALILTHKDRGRFVFTEGKMRSTTRTPVIKATSSGDPYNYRPTLFITIPGSEIDDNGNFNRGTQPWQNAAQGVIAELARSSNSRHSQYKHFAVDWDSDETNRGQVEDVSGLVKDFLKNRIDAWDVVIIGHSRGGIFAHDLTKELVGFSKVKNLHTFLLDPTAAIPIGDLYPLNLHHASVTNEFGSLFYDGNLFDFNGAFPGIGTQSDLPISGYNNYNRGSTDVLFPSTHKTFGSDWVTGTNVGMSRALDDIWARKDIGSFLPDGDSGYESVRVSADEIIIDASIEIADGNLTIDGILKLGDAQASINALIGADGVDIAATVLVASAQLVIRDNHIAVASNTIIASYRSDISLSGIDAQADILLAEGSVSISSGGVNVSASFPGSSISVGSGGVSFNIGGVKFGVSF